MPRDLPGARGSDAAERVRGWRGAVAARGAVGEAAREGFRVLPTAAAGVAAAGAGGAERGEDRRQDGQGAG